jgi:hypothetical protein
MRLLFITILVFLLLTTITANEAGSGMTILPRGELQRGGQAGATCVALPYCPGCNGRGSTVCIGVKEFFPGMSALVAKGYVVSKCRKANALDYCGSDCGIGGLRQKNPNWKQEVERHRARYGGGCYKSCDKSVVCYPDSR